MAVKPKRLVKGDTVGVIAPASPPDSEKLKRALIFMEELGLKVKLGKQIFNKNGYLAGTEQERIEDLHTMFLDNEVKAVFCACGGYGTARLAAQLDYELIKKNPKIFWGYSDITFLHTAFYKKTGLVTFHGPMLGSDLGREDIEPLTKQRFSQLFEAKPFIYDDKISRLETEIAGEASGLLVGGNLSLLVSTLGTEFEIDTRDKLLLIEDVNEEPRSIDRMLNQLFMAGKLTNAAGILVGDFNNCVTDRKQTLILDEVLKHYLNLANRPALSGFKIGHCSPHIAIPLGVLATLNTNQKCLTIEPGIQ